MSVQLRMSPQKQQMIQALPSEVKQQLLDGQHATLDQVVYETATQKLITMWAVDLCAADMEYIFANEVRHVQQMKELK